MQRKNRKIKIESIQPQVRSDNLIMRWLIDEKIGSEFGVLGYTIFPPGERHESHIHENAEEYLIVTGGHGIQVSGKNRYDMESGDVFFIPRGEPHEIMNTSKTKNLEIFFIFAGAESLEKSGYRSLG